MQLLIILLICTSLFVTLAIAGWEAICKQLFNESAADWLNERSNNFSGKVGSYEGVTHQPGCHTATVPYKMRSQPGALSITEAEYHKKGSARRTPVQEVETPSGCTFNNRTVKDL